MAIVGVALIGLIAIAVVIVFPRTGRGLPSHRVGRLLHLGRLSARLSASWLGAKVRRTLAGPEARVRLDEARRRADAQRLAETMGQMKGAFMKLGQMMSFVSEDLPPEYRQALAMLQAEAPPMDFPLIRDVAERELGRPLERAFARFEEKPLAAASIGQVHRARLPSGDEVAVKVQYPGVAEAIRGDLKNVAMLYRMVGMMYPGVDTREVVDELRARLTEELDYEREAKSQAAFHDLYLDHPFIRVPRVFAAHSTARVLTSEWISGRRFAEVVRDGAAERARHAEILYRFIFGSIRYGVFNGDPHPGNYLFGDDGRVVFLDFGCVKYFPDEMHRRWRALVIAHLQEDRAAFRDNLIELGFLPAQNPFSAELLYDYFGYFYEPWHEDKPFRFTPAYNGRSFQRVFRPQGDFGPLTQALNMPRDFVFVNRIQWGVNSILAQLDVEQNWHRIQREFLFGDPPSTPLGEADHAFRTDWAQARGLFGHNFFLTPDGAKVI